MSSLQKFHRRTASFGPPPTWPATAIGGGDITHGFWLGDISSNKLIVAPISTVAYTNWGSAGITRGTISTTNGLANTNTLAGFGQAAHPPAYHCKNLTTGGYNTWYLPAKNELTTMYSNKSATPFATANAFASSGDYWSSTESAANAVWLLNMGTGVFGTYVKGGSTLNVRAVRRTAV